MFRRSTAWAVITAALFSLALSTAAQAQWGRRDDDYRRNDRYGRYDSRALRDAAARIRDRSRDLERDVDRLLDRSRHDDTRREDRINDQARDFRRAAERFRDRAGESNDLSRSMDEARQLLSEAAQIDRFVGRARLDSRAYDDWSQIRADLRTVADFYNLRVGDFDGRRDNGRGFPWPRY